MIQMGIASLFGHQKRAIERAVSQRRLLIVRPFGSGKTLIGLCVADQLLSHQARYGLWVGPAHLLSQVKDEARDWGLTLTICRVSDTPASFQPGLHLASYNRLRLSREIFLSRQWDFVIVDEVHRAKNPSTWNYQLLAKLRRQAPWFVGLTGSPFQNGPYEFFQIVSLFTGSRIIRRLEECLEYKRKKPLTFWEFLWWKLFNRRPNRGPVVGIRNPDGIKQLLQPYIDFADGEEIARECHIPSVDEQVVSVQLEATELDQYRRLAGQIRKKALRQFLTDDLDDSETASSFARLSELRQFLLSFEGNPSSKTRQLCNDVANAAKDPSARILVFSNFLDRGVRVIAECLRTLSVPHLTYTGQISHRQKSRQIRSFSEGLKRVLILSPVGFEGLNLNNTTHIFIADPHFNPEVTRQLVARATRAKSSVSKVTVYHYIAVSDKLATGTVDQAVRRIAERKNQVNNELRHILSDLSFDNCSSARIVEA
jgi:superfamily II DNA or RNA helicase